MRLIDSDDPLLTTPGVDDYDHMEGSLPVDQQQQLLQHVLFEPGLFNDLCRLEGDIELGEGAVDQTQLVEGMLADPLRILPDLATRNGSHPPIIASATRPMADHPLHHRQGVYMVVPILPNLP